jgi:hypothetical protein
MFWEEGSYFWDVHFDLHPDKNRIGSRGGQTDENWRGHFCPAEKSTTHAPLQILCTARDPSGFPRAQRRNHFSPSLPPPLPPPFFGILFATTPFIESPAGKQGQPPPALPTSSMFSFGILFATGVEGRVPFQVKIGSGTVISLREETGVATLLEMSSNPILEVTLLFNATSNRTRTGCGTRFYVCTGDACVFHIFVPLYFVPLYPSILHQLCQTDQGCYYFFFWRSSFPEPLWKQQQ